MYPFTWMVTFLAVLMLTADYLKRIKIGTWGRNIIYSAALMGFFWGQVRLGARTQSERSWQKASEVALGHSCDEALPYYVSLKHRFKDNPYFLCCCFHGSQRIREGFEGSVGVSQVLGRL